MKGKNICKTVLLVLCFLLTVSAAAFAQPAKAEAAKKNGPARKNGKYYYLKDGVPVKNCGKKINGYNYFFGEDGAAYAAPKMSGMSRNIVVKTVKGKQYGFDVKGRAVTGVWMTAEGELYCFNKNGVMNEKATRKYRKALEYMTDATAIRKYLGKPLKTWKSVSCFQDGGTDILAGYQTLMLSVYRNDKTNKLYVLGAYPR